MKNKNKLIIVNLITISRLIGTIMFPIFVNIIPTIGLIIYLLLLLLTDFIDGILARNWKVSTIFGALLDATADKMFGISTMLVVSMKYPIMFLPILTEIIITSVNICGANHGSGLESSNLGKFKTWIFGLGTFISFLTIYANDLLLVTNSIKWLNNIFNYLINNSSLAVSYMAFIMMGADIMVTFDYQAKVKEAVKNAKKEGIKRKNYKLKKGNDLKFALFNHNYYIETKKMPLLIRLGEEYKNERKN